MADELAIKREVISPISMLVRLFTLINIEESAQGILCFEKNLGQRGIQNLVYYSSKHK